MTPRQGRFLLPALEQVQQLQEALPALQVDFPQADEAIRNMGQQWIRQCLGAVHRAAARVPIGVQGLLPRDSLSILRQNLGQIEAQLTPPPLATIEPEQFQLYHLLVVLLTRRLHLGDFLHFVLADGARPLPRPEMLELPWRLTVKRHHEIACHTLRFLIAHRDDGGQCSRHVQDRHLPRRLGWVEQGGETLLEDLLQARSPLFVHQLFEVLLLIEASVSQFVEYLYFVEAGTVGTSREQLRSLATVSLGEAG